jgi:hypothetical protein
MSLLTSLASFLGIEVEELTERIRQNAVLWAVIGVFAAICLAFLLVAAHLGLSLWVGPIWSALIIAGVALVFAAILFIIYRVNEGTAHRRALERRRTAEANALMTGAAVTALPVLLKSPLVRNVGVPIGAALVALYFANRLDTGEPDKK